jgi:RNA-directed DNA polymerase
VYLSLEEIATLLNPVLRGWIQYYGRFYRTELISKL